MTDEPIDEGNDGMAESTVNGNGPQPGEMTRVLLADDNDKYAELLTADLEKRGVKEIVRVYDAEQAVVKLNSDEGNTFDAVVTDISMESQISGLKVLKAARSNGSKRILAVASTGLDTKIGMKFNKWFLGSLYQSDFVIPKKPIKSDGRIFWVPTSRRKSMQS
jgi:CheY-like chemotaxis protein